MVLGWVAAIVGSAISVPQLVRLLRARTSAGLSLLMWQLMVAVGLGWTSHGIMVAKANLIVPNVLTFVSAALVVRLIVKDRGIGPLHAWTLPIVLGGALAGVDILWGAVVYGIATSVPQVIGALAQLVDVVRCPDISGVSPWFLLLNLTIQGLWVWWSLLVDEKAITVAGTSTGAVALATLLWYVARRGVDTRRRLPARQ